MLLCRVSQMGRLVGKGQFGQNGQKLHENDKIFIFGSKQWGGMWDDKSIFWVEGGSPFTPPTRGNPALYLYKSTIWPCMESCCHVCAGASSCYMNCQISCKSAYVGLVIIHLLCLLNSWFIIGFHNFELIIVRLLISEIAQLSLYCGTCFILFFQGIFNYIKIGYTKLVY